MVPFPRTCATPWLSLIAGRCSVGETHRGQQGTPALTLPHMRDGLSVLLMAVLVRSAGPLCVAQCTANYVEGERGG